MGQLDGKVETRRALRLGRLLVNEAGLYASLPMQPFEEIPVEGGRPAHARAGGGAIVNISSGTPSSARPCTLRARAARS